MFLVLTHQDCGGYLSNCPIPVSGKDQDNRPNGTEEEIRTLTDMILSHAPPAVGLLQHLRVIDLMVITQTHFEGRKTMKNS